MIIFRLNTWEIKINTFKSKKIEPILWVNGGMFCIIPIQIIQNAYDQAEMQQKSSQKHLYPELSITWDQGIPVNSKVGYALLGEESNKQP